MKKHLHNSLRALFLSLAVLLSLPMLAEEVEIKEIYYDLNVETKQAAVVRIYSSLYQGEIVIPEYVEHKGATYSVTSIGNEAFLYCSVTSVTIGNSVESIGERAFDGCSGLTSVHISDIAAWCNIDFVSRYYSNPLYYAHHLYLNGEEVKDLVIPNSVTSIGSSAFSGCSGLTSVTIPNSVESIEYGAFYDCSGLTSVTIGNSVTSIGDLAFCGCFGLTSVTIGNSVTSIGNDAFCGCYGLTSVTIPNSVTSIGGEAFFGCFGLTSVTIGNSVESIGVNAFNGCSGLTSVTIGSSVKSIGEEAFANCSELLDVYCYAEKAPSTESDAFNGSYIEYATLHVPDASIISYRKTEPWSRFRKIVALTDEETGIDELKGENGNVKTEIYDLSGRRVQKAQKGIFIRDGKVVVK